MNIVVCNFRACILYSQSVDKRIIFFVLANILNSCYDAVRKQISMNGTTTEPLQNE